MLFKAQPTLKVFSQSSGWGGLYLVLLFCFGCVTTPPPLLEYNLAKTAISAAEQAEAARFDPAHLQEAEDLYRKGRSLLAEREHELARSLFIRARVAAERAENTARALKHKSGEVF